MLLLASTIQSSGPYRKSRSQSSMGLDPGHDSMTWRTWRTWNLGGIRPRAMMFFSIGGIFLVPWGLLFAECFSSFRCFVSAGFHGFHGESSEQWRDMRNGESTSRSKFLVDWDKTPVPCCICTLLAANPSFI